MGSRDRAYEQFWARLIGRIGVRQPDWPTPGKAPVRNWLSLGAGTGWFSYTTSFGRKELCSELYIKVPGDAPAGQRILAYLQSRRACWKAPTDTDSSMSSCH